MPAIFATVSVFSLSIAFFGEISSSLPFECIPLTVRIESLCPNLFNAAFQIRPLWYPSIFKIHKHYIFVKRMLTFRANFQSNLPVLSESREIAIFVTLLAFFLWKPIKFRAFKQMRQQLMRERVWAFIDSCENSRINEKLSRRGHMD